MGRLDELAVACGAIRPLKGDVAEIKRMFVRPEFRGQGFSRQILHELEARAWTLGFRQLLLETGKRQPEAIQLYESANYQRTERYGPYVDCQHSICFTKRLRATERGMPLERQGDE